MLKDFTHLAIANVLMRGMRRRRTESYGLIGEDAFFENGVHFIELSYFLFITVNLVNSIILFLN